MAEKKKSLAERMKSGVKVDYGVTTMDKPGCQARAFTKEDMVITDTPIINLFLSGMLDGGLVPGIEVAAAPSGTGKTSIGLKLVEAFQEKYDNLGEEHLTLYFDNEFGSRDIIAGYEIQASKVLHIPITNIEEMHHTMLAQLEDMEMTDNIFIFVDSVGNLASKKEMGDALEGKSTVDMTRAKSLKAFFRQVTPIINLKRCYTYFIGHVYKEQGMFPKTVVSGGTGLAYAPNGVYTIGKAKIKDGNELIGHDMGVSIHKSRTVKQGSKFVLRFMYGHGIEAYSGMAELATELGICEKRKGRGLFVVYKDREVKWKDSYRDKEFWDYVMADSELIAKSTKYYSLT